MLPTLPGVKPLTDSERAELADCEELIERDFKGFLLVGQTLIRIRDKELYREYGTFEDYCKIKYGWTRQRGYQLISASTIAGELSTIVDIPNEAIARALLDTRLKQYPEARRLALTIAVATAPGGRLTASWLESTIDVLYDAITTEGFVSDDNGDYAALNAAISREAHAKMMDKKRQLAAGKQKPLGVIETTGKELKKIKPEDSPIQLSDRGQYRIVVYPSEKIEGNEE